MSRTIPFVDVEAQYSKLKADIDSRIANVIAHGQFILGPEVGQLESKLASAAGVAHCVTVSSGTDALLMALMAIGVGKGDAVFVPSFTFTASAEVIVILGATPVFIDVNANDFNIDIDCLEAAILSIKRDGVLRPRAIIAVDLYGLPANYGLLNQIARREDVLLIADAAQSFGGSVGNAFVGSLAPVTATSFFPSKPLGCFGDGGALFTDDAETADIYRSIRAHGRGDDKYDIVRLGINSRLDTIQAAVLLSKLTAFPNEIKAREALARRYDEALKDLIEIPARPQNHHSAWAQYTLKLENRDRITTQLKAAGVPTAVYYPIPMHLQPAYREFSAGVGSLPVAERLSKEVLSLPMHAYMTDEDFRYIVAKLRLALT